MNSSLENSVTDIKTQTVYAGFRRFVGSNPYRHQYGSRTALYKFV